MKSKIPIILLLISIVYLVCIVFLIGFYLCPRTCESDIINKSFDCGCSFNKWVFTILALGTPGWILILIAIIILLNKGIVVKGKN